MSGNGETGASNRPPQPRGTMRGFASFDLLFCTLPLILMVSLMLNQAWIIRESANLQADSSQTHAKLAAIADYAVKAGGAQKESQQAGKFSGSASYRPNVIEDSELSLIPIERIRGWMELDSLSIGWDEGEGACIYRIVLHNDEVEKLYVCGD